MLSRNRFWFSQARLSEHSGLIYAKIHLRKPLVAEPGQYINLWMVASLGSVWQSHPFTIVSWKQTPQSSFKIYVMPRQGLTKRLQRNLRLGDTTIACAFTGPHGKALPHTSEHTLVFADDMGIFSVLPLLRKLVHFHQTFQMCARRVHLIWQVANPGSQLKCPRFARQRLTMMRGGDRGSGLPQQDTA